MTPADLNKTRAAFMQRISAPSIPPHALKLAYLIAFKYMDVKTQATIYISQKALADELGGKEQRTIRNLLRRLQPLGLEIETGLGRGNASRYRLAPELAAADTAEKRKSDSAFSAEKRKRKSGNQAHVKADSSFRPSYTASQKTPCDSTESQGERERNRPSADDAAGGAGGLDGPAPHGWEATEEEETAAPSESEATQKENLFANDATEAPEAEIITPDDGYRELRAIYERGHAGDRGEYDREARDVYVVALRDHEHETIAAGARNWVEAYRAGQGVGYLPRLPDWLTKCDFLNHPWQQVRKRKRKRKQANGRYRNGRKPDLAEMAFAYGREDDDDDDDGSPIWGSAQ